MAVSPGTRIGPYEVAAQIGVGGMGEVYRATDTQLGRQVAIKVLPDAFAQDADRLARFEREAKTLAALNHPHIAQIYGLERSGESRALVMELVEGPTLGDLIERRAGPSGPAGGAGSKGPGLHLDEALAIARQIAEALEAAHEQGIVHRDLKPANIKVRPDGTVKVLDFGLAKAMESGGGGASAVSASMSPTITTPAMTQLGMILGTAAYMSPEQARGKPVDKRTDIWAFGCVLFEMLTGTRAFPGEDVTDTLAAVVKLEPDWNHLPADTPARVRQALRVCLQKDPRQRGGDIAAIRLALDGVFETSVSRVESVAAVQPAWRKLLPVAVVVALAALAAASWLRPDPVPEAFRFEVHAPPGSSLPLGTPAISPDGRTIAYAVTGPDGVSRIYLSSIGRIDARVLPGTERGVHPFWSPDGRSLGFASTNPTTLKRIDVDGGAPRELASPSGPWHGTWGQRGDILFAANPAINSISAEGGDPAPAGAVNESRGERGMGFPAFLPDGERFLTRVSGERSSIQLGRLGSMDRILVLDDVVSAPVLAPTPRGASYLLFMRGSDLLAQEFDVDAGAVRGDAVLLVPGIGVVANPPLRPTVGVSPSGILAYQTGVGAELGGLSWVDRAGRQVEVIRSEVSIVQPRLSPDGSAVVGRRVDPASGNNDIWMTDLARGASTRLTFDDAFDQSAVWSPDGASVAFLNNGTEFGIYVVNVNGTGELRRLSENRGSPTAWSPDGRYLLYTAGPRLMLFAIDGQQQPIQVGSRRGNSFGGQFSPDGRMIAFVSSESGEEEVYVQALPPSTGQWKVSIGGGQGPRWRGDGRELFYTTADNALMAVAVEREPGFRASEPKELFRYSTLGGTRGYDVRADGQRFLVITPSDQAPGGNPITVVMNWWAELQAREPAQR